MSGFVIAEEKGCRLHGMQEEQLNCCKTHREHNTTAETFCLDVRDLKQTFSPSLKKTAFGSLQISAEKVFAKVDCGCWQNDSVQRSTW